MLQNAFFSYFCTLISHFLLETDIFCYQLCFKIATDT